MTPLNFQQGLVQPPVEQKWSKRITVYSLVGFDAAAVLLAHTPNESLVLVGVPF